MMKAKLKSPEVAQAKGADFIKKLLKRLTKEPMEGPTKFFYDSAFDFGGEEGQQPMLFIGEIPTKWKKYVKENKTSKTLAAGTCVLDGEGGLKLVVELGKGGKNAVLREVNKLLLKPFCKAYFVDSIDATTEIEDAAETSDDNDDFTSIDLSELVAEAQANEKEANELFATLNPLATGVGNSLKNIRDTIVTDDLIKKTAEAVDLIQKNNPKVFLQEVASWQKEFEGTLNNDADGKKAVAALQASVNKLKAIVPNMEAIIQNANKVQKVGNPVETAAPPVSDDPLETFGNFLLGFKQKSKSLLNIEAID